MRSQSNLAPPTLVLLLEAPATLPPRPVAPAAPQRPLETLARQTVARLARPRPTLAASTPVSLTAVRLTLCSPARVGAPLVRSAQAAQTPAPQALSAQPASPEPAYGSWLLAP